MNLNFIPFSGKLIQHMPVSLVKDGKTVTEYVKISEYIRIYKKGIFLDLFRYCSMQYPFNTIICHFS